jgi:PleD family two-component response regulator
VQRFLQQELDKARRYEFPVSFVRIALDNVEAIREAGGESSFFDALRMIAGIAGQCIRTVDVAARSDEATLLLVLPHTPAEGCAVVVNRLRERLEGISPLPGVPLQVTFAHATFAGATLPSPERVLFGEFFHA